MAAQGVDPRLYAAHLGAGGVVVVEVFCQRGGERDCLVESSYVYECRELRCVGVCDCHGHSARSGVCDAAVEFCECCLWPVVCPKLAAEVLCRMATSRPCPAWVASPIASRMSHPSFRPWMPLRLTTPSFVRVETTPLRTAASATQVTRASLVDVMRRSRIGGAPEARFIQRPVPVIQPCHECDQLREEERVPERRDLPVSRDRPDP